MSTTYTFELTDSSGKEKLTINLTKNLVVRSEWSVIDGNAGHNCLIVDNGVVDDKTVNRLICRSGLEPNIPIIILKHADWNAAVGQGQWDAECDGCEPGCSSQWKWKLIKKA